MVNESQTVNEPQTVNVHQTVSESRNGSSRDSREMMSAQERPETWEEAWIRFVSNARAH